MYSKRLDSDNLENCPWCGKKPIFISEEDKNGNKYDWQVWCVYEFCRARPHVCVGRKYTKEQVEIIWNSYKKEDFIEEKKKPKDLRKFSNYLSKKELRSILIDAKSSKEVWARYLPDFPYLTEAD